jgi:glycosyltransferase involved in cell wall biosynthesis
LPVVAKTASLPEVVGNSGILVDPFSISSIRQGIITAVRLKPDQRQKHLALGLKHLEAFSWSLAAKKIMEAADELALQR